ncbi:hypothetical protein [uncultured Sphaerochaeta sp.]|uniref:hypothetical protein n=1 Tax=uncultured Sphaerochaeta sp. TaxID=886478 RepID=UPI0029CA498B|nr:hypothetical protein [uncultured Sphaerochaeta sp.]
MFIKMNKSGLYVVSDYLPDDAVEVSVEEYGRAMKPTAAQRRRDFLLRSVYLKDKKRFLFETLRAQLKEDGSYEEDPDNPFYQGMTVDEMQLEYAKYVGDDDERAAAILEAKRAAKEYIRDLVDRLAFYNEWEEE